MKRLISFMLLLCGMALIIQCSKSSPTKFDMSEYYLGPEGAELSIFRRDWKLASAPVQITDQKDKKPYSDPLNWYNPVTQYPKGFIRPDIEIPNTIAQTTNILKLAFHPSEENTVAGGIMQYLGDEPEIDLGNRDYLEIMVNGINGRLHIDIGAMSEDVIPNGKLDNEDILPNGKLDPGEDVGLDRMPNDDPRAIAAGGDFWDINGNGEKDAVEPFSMDDWRYERYDPDEDYTRINGTEGNSNDAAGDQPDTEDLNGNNTLDFANDYWTFSLNLQPDHPDNENYTFYKAIDEEAETDFGWRWYKIPLADFSKIGSPSSENIECIRLWVTGENQQNGLEVWFSFITFTSEESES